jgi:phospholipid/cholesterol/gamma-HCH transport system substrate-binding protein
MKREQVNYLAVGSFVLLSLAALIYLLLQLTGSGSNQVNYRVLYPGVHGIVAGTPVFFRGFRVGTVEAIAPGSGSGDSMFELTLSVSAQQPIPDDSIAHVFESGLLGTVSIDIRGGKSARALSPGALIKGAEREDLLGAINAAADEYRMLSSQQIRPLIAKLNLRVDTLADTVEDGARTLLIELHQITASLNRSTAQLETVLSTENSQHIAATLANLQTFSADAAKLGGEMRHSNRELAQAITNADNMLNNTNQMISENRPNLKASLQDLRNTLHVVSEKISSITHHLDGSSRNLHEFSRQIRQNPGLLMGSTPPPNRR